MITLAYSTAESVPGFEDGHIKALLDQDVCASKARKACSDDAHSDLPAFRRCRSKHIVGVVSMVSGLSSLVEILTHL